MATIKINYGGNTYSMVKTSSKITTPSVAVDGGYIPCFSGGRFAQVLVGNTLYTLSPLKVDSLRMACGVSTAFTGAVYLNFPYKISHYSSGSGKWTWTVTANGSPYGSTSQSGYTCSVNVTGVAVDGSASTNGNSIGTSVNTQFRALGTYSVINTAFNKVVKTGAINVNINIAIDTRMTGNYTQQFAI